MRQKRIDRLSGALRQAAAQIRRPNVLWPDMLERQQWEVQLSLKPFASNDCCGRPRVRCLAGLTVCFGRSYLPFDPEVFVGRYDRYWPHLASAAGIHRSRS
jgi:hypothetical protein